MNSSCHTINLELTSILKDTKYVHEKNEKTSLLKKQSTIIHEKERNYVNVSRMKATFICGICFIFILESFMILNEKHKDNGSYESMYKSKDIYPTLLHIQDQKTGEFLDSLQHPLYKSFAAGQFKMNVNSTSDIQMWLNKQRISFHESLTLSFEYNNDKDHFDTLLDSDIVALYCPQNEIDPAKFHDIVTIQQIRQMNSKTFQLGYNQTDKIHVDINNTLHSSQEGVSKSYQFIFRYSDPFQHEIDHSTLTPNDLPTKNSNYVLQWYIPPFPIIRERTCMFRLWRNTTKTPTNHSKYYPQNQNYSYSLITQTDPIIIHSALLKATAIHIAYTQNPTQMNIQFTTASLEGVPVVTYSETYQLSMTKSNVSKKEEWNQMKSSSSTSSFPISWSKVSGTTIIQKGNNACQNPIDEMFSKLQGQTSLHSVVLNDLKYDTFYTYKVGVTHDQGGIIWSKPYTFLSAPAPSAYPITLIAYGHPDFLYMKDSSPKLPKTQLQKWIDIKNDSNDLNDLNATNNIRAIHYFGDATFSIGGAHVWEEWGTIMEPVAARIPVMIGIGNDNYAWSLGFDLSAIKMKSQNKTNEPYWGDYVTQFGSKCEEEPSKRFSLSQSYNKVYSHNIGIVHTIMISSLHNLRKGSAQYKWLEEDLKKINRTTTPFVILESHRSFYDFIDNEAINSSKLRRHRKIENLLKLYNVDLVLSGQHHVYHRSCQGLFHHKCNHGGPLYVMLRNGFHLQHVAVNSQVWTESVIPNVFGFGRITAVNHTTLLWEFIDGNNKTNVLDHVWIKN